MRYVNECGQTITEDQVDLTKGFLATVQVIKEDAEPIDNVNKFVYTADDYEEVQKYFLHKVQSNTPSQLDRIEAQITYTAMMTDTLLEG